MNSDKAFSVISKGIIRGVQSVRGGHLAPREIKRVIAKVMDANPCEDKLAAYAFKAGRNGAIDKMQHEAAVVRMRRAEEQRVNKQLAQAKERWNAVRDLDAARAQFGDFVRGLPANDHDLTREQKIEIVRMVVLEGCDDAQVSGFFPGSTPQQRWQWKCRGVKLLLSHNPPEELARVLRRRLNKS
jgi:hypothetical protein